MTMTIIIFIQLHFYHGDVAEIYEHLPPECLPKDFGGKLDCLETLHGTYYIHVY